MRVPEFLEAFRVVEKPFNSKTGDQFGMFLIPVIKGSFRKFTVVVAPCDHEWKHISVSLPDRCPTWSEMCMIKDLFWDEDETVIQYHPKKSEYVNVHKYCLHLWWHKDIILPPTEFVGPA
jgi:hypothetical protein